MSEAVPQADRIATLDVIRGVAVMGILVMNIIAFAMPDAAYGNPAAYGSHAWIDYALYNFNYLFFDGKMRGLFSFLFGASALLVIERATAKGESPARIHYARMFWLLIFGLAHLYLIWWGDILQHYALIGLILFFFRNLRIRRLVQVAVALLIVQTAMFGLLAANIQRVETQIESGKASKDDRAQFQSLRDFFGKPPADVIAKNIALHRGDYPTILRERVKSNAFAPIGTFFFVGWETLAYMLLGMAMLKSGLLRGDWSDARYRRWLIIGAAIALPAYGFGAWLMASRGYDTLGVALGIGLVSVPFRPFAILAWASGLALLARHGGGLAARIGAAGQMAFSNYLATSLICTSLFYGYGLGLYGRLSRAECYLVVLAIWGLMLLWSAPWLARFRYGPMEWLWRSLARGRIERLSRPSGKFATATQ
ncbi:MAG: hypothetical protein A4S12_06655 [Proteobacteria bacterium SG_bin5]|nr:DUF418 domain-containing protein [Sphingomonas sp.]OQW42665.1 MAG: hypothetical protein A4S12_06655 [Proteobacteria bacterium SG_bin5]